MSNSIDGMVTPTTKSKNNNNKAQSTVAKAGWLGMLFVVLSIGFSSYMVYFGSNNPAAKLMLIPQVAFAVGVLIYRFSK